MHRCKSTELLRYVRTQRNRFKAQTSCTHASVQYRFSWIYCIQQHNSKTVGDLVIMHTNQISAQQRVYMRMCKLYAARLHVPYSLSFRTDVLMWVVCDCVAVEPSRQTLLSSFAVYTLLMYLCAARLEQFARWPGYSHWNKVLPVLWCSGVHNLTHIQ